MLKAMEANPAHRRGQVHRLIHLGLLAFDGARILSGGTERRSLSQGFASASCRKFSSAFDIRPPLELGALLRPPFRLAKKRA